MPKLNPFSGQLVSLVRQMPDEAILALVKDHLGVVGGEPASTASRTPRSGSRRRTAKRASSAKPTARGARKATKRQPAGSPQRARRAALVEAVEKFVLGSKGVGLAAVAKATGTSKVRAQAALKELKNAKRIAYAGDRKFTRYAASKATAQAASKAARAGQ